MEGSSAVSDKPLRAQRVVHVPVRRRAHAPVDRPLPGPPAAQDRPQPVDFGRVRRRAPQRGSFSPAGAGAPSAGPASFFFSSFFGVLGTLCV